METDSNKAAQEPEEFKPHNKTQLADLLGVSVHILNVWIECIQERLGPIHCKTFSSKQVQIMVQTYGKAPVKKPNTK